MKRFLSDISVMKLDSLRQWRSPRGTVSRLNRLDSRRALEWDEKLCMCIGTFWTVGTESRCVELAERLADMLLLAIRTEWTVSESEPLTDATALRWINVHVETLFAILTPTVLREEFALWHAAQIVLV